MSLARKLAKLETIVSGRADEASPADRYWTPERAEAWRGWVIRLLETMPEQRAVVAFAELTTLPAEQWGAITRTLAHLAALGADGVTGAPGSPDRPWALPGPVCDAIEAHPTAEIRSAHDCPDCGFMVPALPGRALLDTCPLCGGEIRWQGFNGKRWREQWERQRAEMATA
jgi:hypothetical protein